MPCYEIIIIKNNVIPIRFHCDSNLALSKVRGVSASNADLMSLMIRMISGRSQLGTYNAFIFSRQFF
jgi:hypothetical protein